MFRQKVDGNVASVHVLTKCGMRFEGIARQKYYKKDTFIDTAQYAVFKSDFKRVNPNLTTQVKLPV